MHVEEKITMAPWCQAAWIRIASQSQAFFTHPPYNVDCYTLASFCFVHSSTAKRQSLLISSNIFNASCDWPKPSPMQYTMPYAMDSFHGTNTKRMTYTVYWTNKRIPQDFPTTHTSVLDSTSLNRDRVLKPRPHPKSSIRRCAGNLRRRLVSLAGHHHARTNQPDVL
jgi:hypothetical protein